MVATEALELFEEAYAEAERQAKTLRSRYRQTLALCRRGLIDPETIGPMLALDARSFLLMLGNDQDRLTRVVERLVERQPGSNG